MTKPKIQTRPCDEATFQATEGLNLHPAARLVLANRATKYKVAPSDLLHQSLKHLDAPSGLPDIIPATQRIVRAITAGEVIGLETDHDVDGVTSHAVIFRALRDYFGHPEEKIRSYIGHRLKEGYGLSDSLCDRILADESRATLIITADNGSSDGPRIQRLKAEGVDTVITDHHGMPEEGPPSAALACVSPAREDSEYPDPMIAGVMVAFLLMCAVRQEMIAEGHLNQDTPKLTGLLDYVAVGTIADCVSLARSVNNRVVIHKGMELINAGSRPCWLAIRPYLGDAAKPLSSGDIGFGVGPRLNAVGRLDDAMVGVRFLLSETVDEAARWAQELNQGNELRKEIEAELKEEALAVGELQAEEGKSVIQVYLSEGHAGVHGIVASRLVEKFGRPAVCFSAKLGEPDIITGSARAIEGTHIRDAMQRVDDEHPGLLLKFGGHEGAGGLTLMAKSFPAFESSFEQAMQEQINGRTLGPVIHSDGDIESRLIEVAMVHGLHQLEPFGREFESPLFTSKFNIVSARSMGAEGIHWRFDLTGAEGGAFQAVWFNAGSEPPLTMGKMYRIAYTPDLNWWNGRAKLQLIVRAADEVLVSELEACG